MKRSTHKSSRCVTGRDVDVLVALYRYRCLSTAQVRTLLFPSDQTANRRLRYLTGAGYVRVLHVPGVAERLVFLARRGAELVAHHLKVPRESITYPTLGREAHHPFFVRHHLEVTDFRIALERECRDSAELHLLGFLPEFLSTRVDGERVAKYLRDVISTGTGAEIAHTPDAVFAVERNGRPALFFMEIDRGTEVVRQEERGVLKAMHFYLDYLRTGGYQRYRDDFGVEAAFNGFRLLFVTTAATRLENIRKASDKLENTDDGARRFIWLALKDQVRTCRILKTMWVSLDPADPTLYTIGGDIGERGHR